MSEKLDKIIAKDVFVDYKIKDTIKKAQKIAPQAAPDALKEGAVSYSLTAMKVMPPPKKGKTGAKIAEQLYWRKTYNVIYLLKHQELIDKIFDDERVHVDAESLRHLAKTGYYYIVIGYKDRGKHQFIMKARTKQEAKEKYGRIKYRGLYKWLWGANLDEIGVKTPPAFRRLLNASPALTKQKHLASIELFEQETSVKIEEEYNAQGIDYFARKAEQKALRSTLNKMKKNIQKKVNQEIKNV